MRQLYKEWWELPAETRGQVWLEKRAREIAGIGDKQPGPTGVSPGILDDRHLTPSDGSARSK